MQRGRGGGRPHTGHTKGNQGAVEADNEAVVGVDARHPVSYTHLDVYKRQIQRSHGLTPGKHSAQTNRFVFAGVDGAVLSRSDG